MSWGAVSCWTDTKTESLLLALCAVWELSPKCEHSSHCQCVRTSSALVAQAGCSHQSLSWLWINTSAHFSIVQTPPNYRWMPVYRGISRSVHTMSQSQVTDHYSSLKMSSAVPCPARGGTFVLLTAILFRIADPLPAPRLGLAWPWLHSPFSSSRGTAGTGDNAWTLRSFLSVNDSFFVQGFSPVPVTAVWNDPSSGLVQRKVSDRFAAPAAGVTLSLVCRDSHLVTPAPFNPGDVLLPAVGGICALPTLTLPLPLPPLVAQWNREHLNAGGIWLWSGGSQRWDWIQFSSFKRKRH